MLRFAFPGPRNTSYHNHSNWSDGADPLEEICRAGKKAGLREFGVSDHWVEPPGKDYPVINWRMDPERLDSYIETLLALKSELDDDRFTLRIGLEVDFFPENADSVLARLKKYPFDYLIGSVHFSGTFPVDSSRSDWVPLSCEQRDAVCETYWKKLEGAARTGEFSFLGHPDLPKKFAMIDNRKYLPHAQRVFDAAKASHTAIEINTSGWFKDCGEAYPCLPMLREARLRRIPVAVNSDSHSKEHLTRAFDRAFELLGQAGY